MRWHALMGSSSELLPLACPQRVAIVIELRGRSNETPDPGTAVFLLALRLRSFYSPLGCAPALAWPRVRRARRAAHCAAPEEGEGEGEGEGVGEGEGEGQESGEG